MAPGELIDLSLSTDDEAAMPQPLSLGKRGVSQRAKNDGFQLLDDDFEAEDGNFGQAWKGNSAKRRRLSSKGPSKPLSVGLHEEVNGHIKSKPGTDPENLMAISSDPIIFTSSPHRSAASHKAKDLFRLFSLSSDSDDSFPEDVSKAPQERRVQEPLFSNRTAALLARLEKPARRKKTSVESQKFSEQIASSGPQVSDTLEEKETGSEKVEKTSVAKLSKKPRLNDAEKAKAKEEKDTFRAATKASKEEAKEKEQKRKAQLKEQKAKERQTATALAEVNKLKVDKKTTAKEMIVDIPSSINGQELDIQIRQFFKNLEIEATSYQAPLPNVIKWRRKVVSHYNQENGYWEPIEPMQIEDENHVMCIMSAQELVDLASTDVQQTNGLDVEGHMQKFKTKFPGSTPIYLIEGLNTWMRKNKTTLNRAYQAAVLSQMDNPGNDNEKTKNLTSRRKKTAHKHVDEDTIEDALLRLQVMNNCLVHHTATTTETAEWVAIFTQHISTIPSKIERMNLNASFCMESGQVKTGDSVPDTYVRMLQEVVRVTAPIAYGIAAEYPSVIALINGFRLRGPSALMDIAKCANKNGATTEARVGPAISRRLYKVFMELDPASTDI